MIFLGKTKRWGSRDISVGRKIRLYELPTAMDCGARRKVTVIWKTAGWRKSGELGAAAGHPCRGCQPFKKWENGGSSPFTKHFIFSGKRIVIYKYSWKDQGVHAVTAVQPGDSSRGQPRHRIWATRSAFPIPLPSVTIRHATAELLTAPPSSWFLQVSFGGQHLSLFLHESSSIEDGAKGGCKEMLINVSVQYWNTLSSLFYCLSLPPPPTFVQ